MIKTILSLLLLFFCFQTFAQKTYQNSVFGFSIEIPENWDFYGSNEFDSEKNECIYMFLLPSKSERVSEWDNSLSFIARGNGYANSLADVKLFELELLHQKFDDLKIVEETNSSLLTRATINNVQYNLLTLMNYQNGISYLASFSFQSNQENIDTSSVKSIFGSISYSAPLPVYDDIIADIEKTPEDATLYYKKALREFNFHNINDGMKDVNTALKIFPFYGEAIYLRGYLHLYLGDTVAACRNFNSSIAEYYLGENEVLEYCNTTKISEELEKREHRNNPFIDFSPEVNHIEYMDSLKKHEFLVLSVSGEANEQVMKYMRELSHLFMLDFEDLDSLYHTETGILQLYTFGIICEKFPDQINSDHKKILKSKNEIMVLTNEQNEPHLMPVKEIAANVYQNIEAHEEEKKMQVKTENEVKKLIKKYSKYPDSYEPISFEKFHSIHIIDGETLKKEKNSEDHVIGHHYRIKDVNGKIIECYNTFKFDHQFRINIIEEEESNTFSAYPPILQQWLDQYGRSLSDKDKKKLGIL